jgi:hypothetical protein
LTANPKLVDLSVNLIPLDGLSPDEIELIMSSAKAQELEGNSRYLALAAS